MHRVIQAAAVALIAMSPGITPLARAEPVHMEFSFEYRRDSSGPRDLTDAYNFIDKSPVHADIWFDDHSGEIFSLSLEIDDAEPFVSSSGSISIGNEPCGRVGVYDSWVATATSASGPEAGGFKPDRLVIKFLLDPCTYSTREIPEEPPPLQPKMDQRVYVRFVGGGQLEAVASQPAPRRVDEPASAWLAMLAMLGLAANARRAHRDSGRPAPPRVSSAGARLPG